MKLLELINLLKAQEQITGRTFSGAASTWHLKKHLSRVSRSFSHPTYPRTWCDMDRYEFKTWPVNSTCKRKVLSWPPTNGTTLLSVSVSSSFFAPLLYDPTIQHPEWTLPECLCLEAISLCIFKAARAQCHKLRGAHPKCVLYVWRWSIWGWAVQVHWEGCQGESAPHCSPGSWWCEEVETQLLLLVFFPVYPHLKLLIKRGPRPACSQLPWVPGYPEGFLYL